MRVQLYLSDTNLDSEIYLSQEILYYRLILMVTQWFGQKIVWVRFPSNLCHIDHSSGHSLLCPMIGDSIFLLLELSRGNLQVDFRAIIVSHHMVHPININPKRSSSVANFHVQRIILPLVIPIEWVFVDNNKYSSNILYIFQIMLMIHSNRAQSRPIGVYTNLYMILK